MTAQRTTRKYSLARNLAIWIGLFFLVSAILILVWTAALHRRESLTAFRNLAASNSAFIKDLRYPMSPQLATQLSGILGLGVGFYKKGACLENIPSSYLVRIAEMAAQPTATARRIEGQEVAVAALGDSPYFLVLVRPPPPLLRVSSLSLLLPVLMLALVCAALAFALGLNIVQPLRTLSQWLPHLPLEKKSGTAPEIPAHILQRKDEIGVLAQTLLATRDSLNREKELRSLSERLAALGRVATSLAHEVKNPAAAIRMHADLLSDISDPTARESIELIKEEVDHIADLVNQWLFVAKSRPAKIETHDLNELASKMIDRFEAPASFAKVTLRRDFEKEPLRVEVDSLRINQVIRNLLQNAIQAMPTGGTVTITTRREKNGLAKLQISDEGPGFSEEALHRFGEPFFSEKEGGMGIGLTLSREVADAHGGSVVAMNQNNPSGATVTLTLPVKS